MKHSISLVMLLVLTSSFGLHAAPESPKATPLAPSPPAGTPAEALSSPQSLAQPPSPQPRRSRMVDSGQEKPVFHLAVTYREDEDPTQNDHCLKNTGSRLKREGSGSAACAGGTGQVFVPER